MTKKIENVSQYIGEISKLTKKKNKDTTIVYRGENQIYPYPCRPNLFRKNVLNKNEFFEKNLFDEMTANKITFGENYLEKAIDAQHGGFPSRLLDVTYNSLVALYFATTQNFTNPIKDNHEENGRVYIFFIEKVFCPSGNNIISIYNSIINRDTEWLNQSSIFQKNHKLIDHIKTNKRIIAQQGAFILFQGDDASSIPECDYIELTISGKFKKNIREELELFFGIHTGSIYPEPSNLVNVISNKSFKINSNEFNFKSELDLVIQNLNRELEYFSTSVITSIHKSIDTYKLLEEIRKVEEIIFTYKIGFEDCRKDINENHEHFNKKIKYLDIAFEKYNNLINEFATSLAPFLNDLGIEFSLNELIIKIIESGKFSDNRKIYK